MPTKLICPDCGGVLGDRKPDEAPCTCYAPNPDSNSDTATLDAPDPVEKLCVVCGKDTVGHRRLKDSRGYICYPCAKMEQAAEKAGKVRCQLCRKLVKPDGLQPLNRKMVCKRCFMDHEESARFKRKIKTENYDAVERRGVIVLSAILVVLGALVAYSLFVKHAGNPLSPILKPATHPSQIAGP